MYDFKSEWSIIISNWKFPYMKKLGIEINTSYFKYIGILVGIVFCYAFASVNSIQDVITNVGGASVPPRLRR